MKKARVSYKGNVYGATVEGDQLLLEFGQTVHESEVTWLPPLEAGTIFALGLNFADHASELAFNAPKEPLVFLKGPNTLIGHHGETPRPTDVTHMHYECELAVVIGRQGKNITKDEAYDYVAGYTIANDYAFRDYLENYYRPNFRVKNRDNCTPIGPWIVDKDDVSAPMNLALRTYVNGTLEQEGSTKDMIFSVPYLIEYLSSFMTLNEGDVILTGTPKGPTKVNVGDEVVTEIEGIGRLANTIIEEQPAPIS
ncbi:fumarylacetoacetate hydrolase family protein [Pontibacillus salipaludis]|uniref:fumarylacetoacetate hydrolase family protein n=1 Tax=Pontibacillus salipaludis TaxID=1697394 RepID=UPI0031E7C8A0